MAKPPLSVVENDTFTVVHTGTSAAPRPAVRLGLLGSRGRCVPLDFAGSLVPKRVAGARTVRVRREGTSCPARPRSVGRERDVTGRSACWSRALYCPATPEAGPHRQVVNDSFRLRPGRRWRRWWVRRAGGSRYG